MFVIVSLWVVTPCEHARRYLRHGETYYLYVQGWRHDSAVSYYCRRLKVAQKCLGRTPRMGRLFSLLTPDFPSMPRSTVIAEDVSK